MTDLSTLRLSDADGFYESLVQTCESLSDDDSALFTAKLALLLANQVGDREVLEACLDAARSGLAVAA